MSAIYALKIFEGLYTYVTSAIIYLDLEKLDENMTLMKWYGSIDLHNVFGS